MKRSGIGSATTRRRMARANVTGPVIVRARIVGPTAMGPLAIAVAAVGAVAIGRLAIGNAVIRKLRAAEIEIGSLKVRELEVAGQRWHGSANTPSPHREQLDGVFRDLAAASPHRGAPLTGCRGGFHFHSHPRNTTAAEVTST